MADNVQANPATGGAFFATDFWTANAAHVPISKIMFGALDTDYVLVADASGQRLPVQTSPAAALTTDWSGAVMAAGTSQDVMPANADRKGGVIVNPPSGLASLFIDFGTPASNSNGKSIELVPGVSFLLGQPGGAVITDQVTITSAVDGQKFQAKEYQ